MENRLWSICGSGAGLPYLLWRTDCGVFVDLVLVNLTSCGDQTVEYLWVWGRFTLPIVENRLWGICGSSAGLSYLLWRTHCGVFVGLGRVYLTSCGDQTVEYLWV